jgi:hypothetical protein
MNWEVKATNFWYGNKNSSPQVNKSDQGPSPLIAQLSRVAGSGKSLGGSKLLPFKNDVGHSILGVTPKYVIILVRSGCDEGGYACVVLSMVFVSLGFSRSRYLYVYGGLIMVPNQRQLIIVVSDWGSYLGSHFPWVFV